MKINWWPPCLVIYTDDLPSGRGAEAGFLNVNLRPKYEGDEGLLHHELTHEWQGILMFAALLAIGIASAQVVGWPAWVAGGVLGVLAHVLLYKNWLWYRCRSEVYAYQVQMKYPNGQGGFLPLDDAAWRLVNSGYDIELTLSEARELLKG